MSTLEQRVRKQSVHFLTPGVAACAGQLQQVWLGGQSLTPDQVTALAKRFGLAS